MRLAPTVASRYLRSEMMNRLRERVADALRRHAGNFGDRQVHEAALVGIQRAELLVDAGLLRLLGEKLRHLPQLDVLALAVAQRVDERRACRRRAPAEAMSTTCCSALSGSPRWRTSSSASSPARFEPRAVGASPRRRPSASMPERGRRRVRGNRRSVACVSAHGHDSSRAAASVLPPPTRFTRRSAGRPDGPDRRRADHVVRHVLLADAPDVARPASRSPGRRRPEEHEREHDRHEHHHLLLRRIAPAAGVIRCCQSMRDAHQHRRDVVADRAPTDRESSR